MSLTSLETEVLFLRNTLDQIIELASAPEPRARRTCREILAIAARATTSNSATIKVESVGGVSSRELMLALQVCGITKEEAATRIRLALEHGGLIVGERLRLFPTEAKGK